MSPCNYDKLQLSSGSHPSQRLRRNPVIEPGGSFGECEQLGHWVAMRGAE
jgi:hypothetical protein